MTGNTGLSDEHARWFEERGIPCEVAAEAGCYSEGRALCFPYVRKSEVLYVKLRMPQKRFALDRTGAKLALWQLDRLAESQAESRSDTLIITEGEIDALSWMAAGAACVTTVPNGASSDKPGEEPVIYPASDTRFGYLWEGGKLIPELTPFKRFILATDADIKGQVLRDELAVRLGRERCWWLPYPEGCKDTNDVLQKHGLTALTALLDDARPMVPNALVTFSEIPRRTLVSFDPGWTDLAPHLRLYMPELVVVTGPPMAGKSQFTLHLAANMARIHGIGVAILQFEDDPERNREDLLAYARAWHQQTEGKGIDIAPAAWVDCMFRTIGLAEDQEDAQRNLEWLRERIEEAATRHDCRIIVIDPWNEIEHLWERQVNETAYLNNALRLLKQLARRLQIAIWIVAHPDKRSGKDNTTVDDWSAYDISGGAVWNNKADHVVIVFRPNAAADETIVKVAKSKNWRLGGIPGAVRMRFTAGTAGYECLGKVL